MSQEMMMIANWLFKFAVVWMGLSIMIMATWWYLVTTIKPLCPDWWRRVVVDEEPESSEIWIKPRR